MEFAHLSFLVCECVFVQACASFLCEAQKRVIEFLNQYRLLSLLPLWRIGTPSIVHSCLYWWCKQAK